MIEIVLKNNINLYPDKLNVDTESRVLILETKENNSTISLDNVKYWRVEDNFYFETTENI